MISEFRAKINIISLLENFIIIKKFGRSYKALCPFHSEKTPSFVINEKEGFYYCFGCGEKGDAISFLQKYKNLDFKDAIKEISRLENIALPDLKERNEYYKALKFLKELQIFFKNNLLSNEYAKNYLFNRGLSEEDFDKYNLGFVPLNQLLIDYLKANDYIEIALYLRLVYKSEKGLYSNLQNRLSIALFDSSASVRGFACRALKNYSKAKYINSANSAVFNKSFLLYNFHKAKKEVLNLKKLFIAEGYFDVFSLNKLLKLENIVATCGTSFSKTHLSLILKHIKEKELKLIFIPDKDMAGFKAVISSIMLCFENDFYNIEIALLNENVKDLGELLNKKEIDKNKLFSFYKAFNFLIKFKLKHEFNNDKKILFNYLKKYLMNIKNPLYKIEFAQIASEFLNLDYNHFFIKETVYNEKKDDNKLLKACLKTCLFSETFLYRFDNLIEKDILKHYLKDYLDFKDKGIKSHNLKKLELDDSISLIKESDYSLCLTALMKLFFKERIQEAKKSHDYFLIFNLTKQMQNLSEGF